MIRYTVVHGVWFCTSFRNDAVHFVSVFRYVFRYVYTYICWHPVIVFNELFLLLFMNLSKVLYLSHRYYSVFIHLNQ